MGPSANNLGNEVWDKTPLENWKSSLALNNSDKGSHFSLQSNLEVSEI